MPQLEYFIVAQTCSQDVSSNSMSIFNILNDVRVLDFPSQIHELCAVSGWIMDEREIKNREEFQLRVQFEMPNASDNHDFRANLEAATRFQNVYLRFLEVPATEPGDITVRLFLNDEEKAHHTIQLAPFDAD